MEKERLSSFYWADYERLEQGRITLLHKVSANDNVSARAKYPHVQINAT